MMLGIGKDLEYLLVEVWVDKKKILVINYYNPGNLLELNKLEEIEGQDRNNVTGCGDFNAHKTLWGGEKTDNNGHVIEEVMP